MNVRRVSSALLPFAAVALCGPLALAQPPAPQPAPAAPPSPPAATDAPASPQNPAPVVRPAPGRVIRIPRPPMEMMHDRPFMDGARVNMHPFVDGNHVEIHGPFGVGEHGMWWKDANLVQQLNLTPDQIKRMDGIFEQSRLQLIDLHANLQKQEILLEPMLSANPVDTAKAMAQIDKVAQARADLEKADAKMFLGIRAVLTADQWTKLNERHRGPGRDFDRRGGPAPAPTPATPAEPRGAR